MSCNCEYGQCTQSHGCPVRSTPLPGDCLKAKQCLSANGDCPCNEAVKADESPLLPLSGFDYLCIAAVMVCGSMALLCGAHWLGKWIANHWTGITVWINTTAQHIVNNLPMTPFF